MSQVLEAPETQDHEFIATAEARPTAPSRQRDARVSKVTQETPRPLSLWRAIMSIFTGSESRHIPACAATRPQYETALEHISRIDPYLYIKALSG